MSDTDTTIILIEIGVVLLLALLFSPTRKFVTFLLGQAWKAVIKVCGVIIGVAQKSALHIWRAHVVLVRNLAPRGTVLPTVAKKGTRRD